MLKTNMTVLEGNMKKYLTFIILAFCVVFISAQKDSISNNNITKSVSPAGSATDKSPDFPGGHQAFVKEILSTFRTSLLSSLNITKARAVASFVIETDGSMTDIKIESYENDIIKREFLKSLNSVNTKWIPGVNNGIKTRMKMRQPLIFSLE
ncbi:hypothetical protein [Chryseobacterium sp. ISL-6]|uniref:hypothetical protein n=1 Tax=Chryseobacterium sp. ISL-6 TaxID=2819143 RepID=UPI001BE7B343|nr:hypothetical protein [Chryseobacterium sp. ISL-6]MBT2621559.1 hypothetical protein [Chryseobacterium sp. ISL-6]